MGDLTGLRVVVTRAAHQAADLAQALELRGAEVLCVPVIAISPPADLGALQKAAQRVDNYDWVIFTSGNAVEAFTAQLALPPGQIKAAVAVIGEATAARARAAGFRVTLSPATEQKDSESLLTALRARGVEGRTILLPCAAVTRDVLPQALRRQGALVDVVEAYRTVQPDGAGQLAAAAFAPPKPDWVSFASPSAVDHLLRVIDGAALQGVAIASIGPVTSAAVRKHGLAVTAEARTQTASALVDAIASSIRGADRAPR